MSNATADCPGSEEAYMWFRQCRATSKLLSQAFEDRKQLMYAIEDACEDLVQHKDGSRPKIPRKKVIQDLESIVKEIFCPPPIKYEVQ